MDVPISDVELYAWGTLCDDATPGPWFDTDQPDGVLRVSFYPLVGGTVPFPPVADRADHAYATWAEFPGDAESYEWPDWRNAAFIAAARSAMPRLIAEVRRLRAEPGNGDGR